MRRPRRPIAQRAIVPASTSVSKEGPSLDIAIGDMRLAIERLRDEQYTYTDVDLVIGTNKVSHGLGKRPVRVEVMPYEADDLFAWGFNPGQPDNPIPERVAEIEVIGVAMTARIFFS